MSKKAASLSGPRQSASTTQNAIDINANQRGNANNNEIIFDQTFTSEPPPYSSVTPVHNNSISIATRSPSRLSTALPGIDFSKYSIPEASLSKDGSTVSTYHPSFTSNPSTLIRFVQEQARLPPLPYIHIAGAKRDLQPQRDFDIKINMLSLFLAQENNQSNQWNYVKLVGDEESAYRGKHNPSTLPTAKGGLDEWAKRFCKETSTLKSFTLTRQLSNWNSTYIEGQIRSLIASTGYDQPVTVTFPVKYAKVVVYPPKSSQSFFTTLVSPLLEKRRFEIIRAVWPYASLPPGANAAAAGRSCVAQTEETWWEEWRDVLRWSIVNKRNGWVTIDDIAEYRMAPSPPASNPWEY
ncbi:uncharacterized protein TRUGW13939_09424 [Talaromyces rugulosus]|uniref:Uncharacterized protein n=1 Tax=Talaromyces rugulosus TaxID=121627 RepID=A0A7H8R9S5_TALRU|nr:uncharacterized protein TRUGW13939_09424 [Talaromyces rugulosus]QKX62265.1 hypothetical protein TRUGW13939_09424 [Talaromyces rugulosus]